MIGEQTTISILVGIRFGFQNGNHYNLNYLYNFLNLISEVKQGTTVKANYKWSATGAKLSVRDGAGTNGYDYMGSIVYKKNGATTDVDVINFSSGVIRKQSGSYMVNYFINDHLGSTRVIVDGSGTVKEKNDYYPFGARHKRTDYIASDNRYKYNGKEEQTTGDVGFIDYGARMYDARIGRWHSVDRFAEKYYSYSPYSYGANDPAFYMDINGDSLWVNHRNIELLIAEGKLYNKDGTEYQGKTTRFIRKTLDALGGIDNSKTGGKMIDELQSSKHNFIIVKGKNEFKADSPAAYAAQAFDDFNLFMNTDPKYLSGGSGGTISWNPSGTSLPTLSGFRNDPSMVLAHEMGHGWDAKRGMLNPNTVDGYSKSEWQAVYIENQIRGELGLPLRTHYGSAMTGEGVKTNGIGPRMLDASNKPFIKHWTPYHR